MANFTSGNLQYAYSWSSVSGDNPKLRGEPDSSLLNRREGYEVLYMIQKLMDRWDFKIISSGHKIERMIQAAPGNLHSQLNIQNWILQNWNRY